mmetsp:Transcript_21107/g.18716  ORF Transcript_21107/g.18716 Transcript_21107/m.18716 type:complete len:196 (+) Transcript_21107:133-720(+)
MGKPPNYKVSQGAYHFSPGPAAYRTGAQLPINYGSSMNRSLSNSRSPKKTLDSSFDLARANNENRANVESFNMTHTSTNFGFKESGSQFGSSERKPLNIQEKLDYPGPGSYTIREKIVYPKCKDVSFGIGPRKAKFLQNGSSSPGPAQYKQKPLIGKDLSKLKIKQTVDEKLRSNFGKRTNSVFAMSGKNNIHHP